MPGTSRESWTTDRDIRLVQGFTNEICESREIRLRWKEEVHITTKAVGHNFSNHKRVMPMCCVANSHFHNFLPWVIISCGCLRGPSDYYEHALSLYKLYYSNKIFILVLCGREHLQNLNSAQLDVDYIWEQCKWRHSSVKEIAQPKMKILSSITHPHVVLNP